MKNILLSLLAVSSIATAATESEVKAEVSYRDQIMIQAEQFVERAVNMIVTPFFSDKDVECLARNIFYESGSEPLEGKVAVGLVTINRSQDPRYPNTICGVVHQKSTVSVPKQVTEVRMVKTGMFAKPQEVKEVRTTWVPKTVHQFSWVGQRVPKIKPDDPRWIESRRIAEELSRGGYKEYQLKYGDAMNFHAVYVKPGWKLPKIGRVGNHIFYENPPKIGG
jgi:spore germination cell wall hydrolase CwlJ-like protein